MEENYKLTEKDYDVIEKMIEVGKKIYDYEVSGISLSKKKYETLLDEEKELFDYIKSDINRCAAVVDLCYSHIMHNDIDNTNILNALFNDECYELVLRRIGNRCFYYEMVFDFLESIYCEQGETGVKASEGDPSTKGQSITNDNGSEKRGIEVEFPMYVVNLEILELLGKLLDEEDSDLLKSSKIKEKLGFLLPTIRDWSLKNGDNRYIKSCALVGQLMGIPDQGILEVYELCGKRLCAANVNDLLDMNYLDFREDKNKAKARVMGLLIQIGVLFAGDKARDIKKVVEEWIIMLLYYGMTYDELDSLRETLYEDFGLELDIICNTDLIYPEAKDIIYESFEKGVARKKRYY